MEHLINRKDNLVNDVNDSMLLHLVKERGPLARIDIVRITRLDPSTISRITARLIESRLIRESTFEGEIKSGKIGRKIGRRPIFLEVNPDGGYILGMEIGAWTTKVVITDLNLQVLSKFKIPTEAYKDRETVLNNIFEHMDNAIRDCGINRQDIKGIGIGISGIVDDREGVCLFAANFNNWKDVPIKALVEEKFRIKTFITNTLTIMTLGEKYYGEGKDTELKDLICINLGIGIGAGIVLHEELFLSSPKKHVGNIGHMIIDKNGLKCNCGNFGCLEAFAGGWAIAKQAIQSIKEGRETKILEIVNGEITKIDAEIVARAAKDGDDVAREIFTKAGRHIGFAIAILMNLYYPDKIVLEGGLIQAGDVLFNPIMDSVGEHVSDEQLNKVEIVISRLEGYAGALGAARLVSHEVFKTPLLHLIRA